MSTVKTLLTLADFAELEDDGTPYELVRGELVEMVRPNFEHGIVCANVALLLGNWNRSTSAGFVVANDTGVVTSRDPDSVRGPDCFFVKRERAPETHRRRRWLEVAPDLAVEVLSPSDRWREVLAKVAEYLEAGTAEVWVLDPAAQTLHNYRPDGSPRSLAGDDEVMSEAVLPGFSCRAADFFRDVETAGE
ncbi:MAG: Uma2 family endonuclease [Planctomycetales bacterium]